MTYDPWRRPNVGDVCLKNGKCREVVAVLDNDYLVTYRQDGELKTVRWTSWWSWCFDGEYTEAA